MNPWLIVLVVLAGLFVVLYIVALIKRPGSRYQNKPEERNPMEGKYVRFVENSEEKENADGVRGHLEAIGPSNHTPSFYERVVKRILDLILSFFGLVILSLQFFLYSQSGFLSMIRALFCSSRSGLVETNNILLSTSSAP